MALQPQNDQISVNRQDFQKNLPLFCLFGFQKGNLKNKIQNHRPKISQIFGALVLSKFSIIFKNFHNFWSY